MCGINGIINFNQAKVNESDLFKMMNLIKHRGPDDQGTFVNNNIGFGFVRLSIIDLSPSGHQPFKSADERYTMVFNGEIFNYIELRTELEGKGVIFKTKTDTEVLLNAYIYYGEEVLHKLNGMWAMVVYDSMLQTVFISRDRFGIKPFYYYYDDHAFYFSSEIPSLLSVVPIKPKANYNAIFDYMVYNKTDHGNNTFFEGIQKLRHGHKLNIDARNRNQEIVPIQWYNLANRVDNTSGFNTPYEFKEELKRAIRLRLRSDVPLGVCLSGGLDSSTISSIIIEEFRHNNLHTFSSVFDDSFAGNERNFIDLYSHKPGQRHFVTPTHLTLLEDIDEFVKCHAEPLPSTGPYAQYKVMELAKNNVVVTIDGQGADEHLAGYHYFFGFYFKDLLLKLKLWSLLREVYFYLKIHRSLFAIKTFFFFMLPKTVRTKAKVTSLGYLNDYFTRKYKHNQVIADNLYGSGSLKEALINHFNYKLEHLLKWEDRNSMYFSIEARVPFLDYQLVEKSLATSAHLIIRDGMTKYILRESMNGILDEKIRMRVDKNGFDTPQDQWFRTPEWQEKIWEIITSNSFKNRGIIDPEKAKIQYKKHLSKEISIAREIWKWIHLELWFRKFIDE
ncbi:MAG: asparagine synthase (glutamine-hydrolyzing) [Bacteroidota bacterium]|jgi:asparagine synthase (glutamine-hydrolysing)